MDLSSTVAWSTCNHVPIEIHNFKSRERDREIVFPKQKPDLDPFIPRHCQLRSLIRWELVRFPNCIVYSWVYNTQKTVKFDFDCFHSLHSNLYFGSRLGLQYPKNSKSSQRIFLLFFGYCKPNCIQYSWGTWLVVRWLLMFLMFWVTPLQKLLPCVMY